MPAQTPHAEGEKFSHWRLENKAMKGRTISLVARICFTSPPGVSTLRTSDVAPLDRPRCRPSRPDARRCFQPTHQIPGPHDSPRQSTGRTRRQPNAISYSLQSFTLDNYDSKPTLLWNRLDCGVTSSTSILLIWLQTRALDGITLIATSRPSCVSRARYTSPIPPSPIFERIS